MARILYCAHGTRLSVSWLPCHLLQLYNIVVDNEHTGKQLLEKGRLKRRFTIIPLNKIAGKSINDGVVRKAQSLVRGRMEWGRGGGGGSF